MEHQEERKAGVLSPVDSVLSLELMLLSTKELLCDG